MCKKSIFAVVCACLAVVLVACGGQGADGSVSTPSAPATQGSSAGAANAISPEFRTFTPEELAEYDGKDGRPAYVAVDGIVYDVTSVPQWENGEHYEGMTAGQDLTDAVKNQSPHGLSVLESLPVVGEMA